MEYRKESQGLQTFIEHLGPAGPLLVVCLAFDALLGLRGNAWLAGSACGMALQIAGAALIGYAKMPAYREGRFFTFGVKSVPATRARQYRWGWRVFLGGAVLATMLLVSGP